MKRGGDSQNEGSLELLLDTICNTFGGILFISILVVILLNITSEDVTVEPPSESAQQRLQSAEDELLRTEGELNTLQIALREQKAIEQQIVDPSLKKLIEDVTRSQQETTTMFEDKNSQLQSIVQSQTTANEIAQQIKQTLDQMSQASAELEQIERQLQQEIQNRTRAAKLPKTRPTQKQPVVLFLRNGRLVAYSSGEFNAAELNVTKQGSRTFVEPIPTAGMQVSAQRAGGQHIDSKLDAEFQANRDYVKVFVWPDSFKDWERVQDRLVSKGFEYSLQPIPPDKRIEITEHAQRDRVQ